MKNNKKVIFAAGAILIAAAIFVISEKMASIRPPEHRTRFFPTLEERHISAITVNDNGRLLKLEKQGGGDSDEWTVGAVNASGDIDSAASNDTAGGFSPADGSLVQIALEKIVSLKKGEPVSVNPEKQAAFEIGDSGKSYVKVYAGKEEPAGVLLVGKSGPDWNSNYARLAGSDTVYLIPGWLRQSLFFDIERWRKKAEVTPDSSGGAGADTADTIAK
jgi:hypothetical protein